MDWKKLEDCRPKGAFSANEQRDYRHTLIVRRHAITGLIFKFIDHAFLDRLLQAIAGITIKRVKRIFLMSGCYLCFPSIIDR
ncbi:MAG: hypothetical protein ABH865_00135 [Candidatus Omnitrophota bacterium]